MKQPEDDVTLELRYTDDPCDALVGAISAYRYGLDALSWLMLLEWAAWDDIA